MERCNAFEHTTLHSTLVAVWVADPTLEAMRSFANELEKLWSRHRSGIQVLNIVGETTGIPDAPVRQLLSQQFESMRGRLLCMAVAVEKEGVAGTMSRAVLSTLLTITRRPFQMSVHFQRGQAAEWLAQQPNTPSAAQLLDVAASLDRRRGAA